MSSDPAVDLPGRILLAEDSAVVRAMVRQILESAGYLVDEAANGELAYATMRQIRPDVAILNVEMPVLGGRELLRRLKADPEFSDIPVIFLTGRTSTPEIVEGLRLGAHDYLRKPFEPSELIARVSAAIRVARLQQQLSKQNAALDILSRTDQLTGLANRRHGEERLNEEIASARRHERPLALLMLDVDHFKSVNDRYGHVAGDTVLREIATRMQSVLRADDIAARWGGEEFLIILSETDLDGAVVLGERMLGEIRGEPVDVGGGVLCPVSASIGAAGGTLDDPDHFVRSADDALYRAKASGRDRVCRAD